MDINRVHNLHHGKPSASERVKRGDEFKQIFDQKLDEVGPADLKNSRAGIVRQGDKFLALLDDYARQLIDPTRTLRDIEPLVERIETEVGIIEGEVLKQFPHDKDLERLIRDLAVTADVAVFKFQRGDYI